MKIVIDISDDRYETLVELNDRIKKGESIYKLGMYEKAIANGVLLDKIKTQIRRMDYLTIEDGSDGYDYYINRDDVLQILDKSQAESEDADADSD